MIIARSDDEFVSFVASAAIFTKCEVLRLSHCDAKHAEPVNRHTVPPARKTGIAGNFHVDFIFAYFRSSDRED